MSMPLKFRSDSQEITFEKLLSEMNTFEKRVDSLNLNSVVNLKHFHPKEVLSLRKIVEIEGSISLIDSQGNYEIYNDPRQILVRRFSAYEIGKEPPNVVKGMLKLSSVITIQKSIGKWEGYIACGGFVVIEQGIYDVARTVWIEKELDSRALSFICDWFDGMRIYCDRYAFAGCREQMAIAKKQNLGEPGTWFKGICESYSMILKNYYSLKQSEKSA